MRIPFVSRHLRRRAIMRRLGGVGQPSLRPARPRWEVLLGWLGSLLIVLAILLALNLAWAPTEPGASVNRWGDIIVPCDTDTDCEAKNPHILAETDDEYEVCGHDAECLEVWRSLVSPFEDVLSVEAH